MSVESGLVARLKAQAPSTGNRVAPQPLPHEWLDSANLPALTYLQIPGGDREYSQDGDSNLKTSWFQIDVWATTMEQCTATMAEVDAGLSGYKGALGDVTCGGIYLRTAQALPDPETQLKRLVITARVLWSG